MKQSSTVVGAACLSILILVSGSPSYAQDPQAPLPELDALLKEVRQKLTSDRLLLNQYTYTQKNVEKSLDGKGNVKKTEEAVSEVYPSLEPGLSYQRVIERDGKPVPQKELEKHDREHEKRLKERERKLEREGTSAREKRRTKEAEEKRKEEAAIDELFRMYAIKMLRREILSENATILLEFNPRPDFKPQTDEGKILKKISGRAWISETDHEIVRLEVELIDNLSVGMGVLARLNKGAKGYFQRRKVNNEIWLPAEAHFTGSARILLFKGMHIDTLSQFSGHKKFSVETTISFPGDRVPR